MKRLPLTEANCRAVLKGTKTVTRRVRKECPHGCRKGVREFWVNGEPQGELCDDKSHRPPYKPGETVALTLPHRRNGRFVWDAVSQLARCQDPGDNEFYGKRSYAITPREWTVRPAFLMPVWAALHFAEIISDEPRMLGDVTDEDAILEGCEVCGIRAEPGQDRREGWSCPGGWRRYVSARKAYEAEWDALNAKRGYPWRDDLGVWRIEFRLLRSDETELRSPKALKGDIDATD